MMIKHTEINDKLLTQKIKNKEIIWGGNSKLKIYGTLQCKSGKRMLKINRVFFISEDDIIRHRFRPCGHCMKVEYRKRKNGLI